MNVSKSFSGGAPAGAPGDAAAAPTLGLLVTNDRDHRALVWLRSQVPDDRIAVAVASLSGNRKPYISNVAKALGFPLPKSVALTPQEIGLQRIQTLKSVLHKP